MPVFRTLSIDICHVWGPSQIYLPVMLYILSLEQISSAEVSKMSPDQLATTRALCLTVTSKPEKLLTSSCVCRGAGHAASRGKGSGFKFSKSVDSQRMRMRLRFGMVQGSPSEPRIRF